VRRGLDQIQAEVDRIFDMLVELEQVVVFLDEFDEMVRERDSSDEPFSRLLTNLLLPKLSRLSDRRLVVFVIATNHIERFDAAIRRPGRFDMVLPVLPPSFESKMKKMPEAIADLFLCMEWRSSHSAFCTS
jgi:transitional endoplasmic reticulum ATPase